MSSQRKNAKGRGGGCVFNHLHCLWHYRNFPLTLSQDDRCNRVPRRRGTYCIAWKSIILLFLRNLYPKSSVLCCVGNVKATYNHHHQYVPYSINIRVGMFDPALFQGRQPSLPPLFGVIYRWRRRPCPFLSQNNTSSTDLSTNMRFQSRVSCIETYEVE